MIPIKDAYYFSHDSNAIIDPKILDMRADYGLEGYGLYWVIIEMLRNQVNYKLEYSKSTTRAIKTLSNTSIDVQNFIKDCIDEYSLFKTDQTCFYSESLIRRMDYWTDTRQKRTDAAKKAARARWKDGDSTENVCERNAQEVQSHSEGNAQQCDLMPKKRKESKRKESIINNSKATAYKQASDDAAANEEQIRQIKSIFKNQELDNPTCAVIYAASKGDIALINEKYILSTSRQGIRNQIGWVITALHDNYKSQSSKQSSEFIEREYDYAALEMKLLGRA